MRDVIERIRQFERQRRFWRRVEVRGRLECWPWTGDLDPDGYARFDGRRADARAWELARGAPPPGALEHSCGNPRCVNPDHLHPRD